MPTKHLVIKGECLSRIARRYGFANWRKIYDAPENAAFRAKHPNPDLIYPGDVLVIPDKTMKQVPLAAGSAHRLQLTEHEPLPASIEFAFVRDSDPNTKLSGLDVEFQLPPNGTTRIETTGPDGLIRIFAPDLVEGTVRIVTIRNRSTTPEQNFDRFGRDVTTGMSYTIALPADPMHAALPVVLKRTARRPGLQENGSTAADMLRGDFTKVQILDLGSMFQADDLLRDLDTAPASDFFVGLRQMATEQFATGELEGNIERMIDRFEANTGADYSDPVLTKAVREHDQTMKLEQLVRTRLGAALDDKKGDISLVTEGGHRDTRPGSADLQQCRGHHRRSDNRNQ